MMEALLKKINTGDDKVFEMINVQEPFFFPEWHFHPEYEIMLVLEGTGIRFVGDSMERFQPGDLVFYGADLPHLYRSDKEYYQQESDLTSKAIVIYFRENFLGNTFWKFPETLSIRKLFSLSKRGMKFEGKIKNRLRRRILKIDGREDGFKKIIDILTILKIMADTNEYSLLSSRSFTTQVDDDDCERMNRVYQFILVNFAKNPSLEEVAEIAHMSKTAFCRYFKSHTNKTYTQFLNEVKIGHACKLLIEDDLTVSQICFESGYNTFTHFNNEFKKITGLTPTQYQDKHGQYDL